MGIGPKSIRGKVTLAATGATALAMALVVGVTAYAMQQMLTAAISHSLDERLDQAQALVAQGDYQAAIDLAGTEMMQVIDEDGNVLAETPNARGLAAVVIEDDEDGESDRFERRLDALTFERDEDDEEDDDEGEERDGADGRSSSAHGAASGTSSTEQRPDQSDARDSGQAAAQGGASGGNTGGASGSSSNSGSGGAQGSAQSSGTSSRSASGGANAGAGRQSATAPAPVAAPRSDDDDDEDDAAEEAREKAEEEAKKAREAAEDAAEDAREKAEEEAEKAAEAAEEARKKAEEEAKRREAAQKAAQDDDDDDDDDEDDDDEDDEDDDDRGKSRASKRTALPLAFAYTPALAGTSDILGSFARGMAAAPAAAATPATKATPAASEATPAPAAASTTASPSATSSTPSDAGATHSASPGAAYVDASDVLGDEGPYLVKKRVVTSPDGTVTLAAITSIASALQTAALTTQLLATIFLALLCLVVAFTWNMAARTLQPVEQMRSKAESITASDLSERIPVPSRDKDLSRLATTFNDLLARVEASFAEQKRFVSDASHELKSPVAATGLMLDALRAHPDAVDKEQVVADLTAENDRLGSIVGDLLTLARSDEGRMPIDAHPVDMMDLLLEEAASLRARSSVAVDTSGVEPVVCNADADLVSHALRNLLDNAARYANSMVKVSCTQDGNVVRVVVSDNGCGIAPEDRERVFDRFVCLEDSRTNPKGTGLGLPVARSIAQRHGGTLVFGDSELGAGATAILEFPL